MTPREATLRRGNAYAVGLLAIRLLMPRPRASEKVTLPALDPRRTPGNGGDPLALPAMGTIDIGRGAPDFTASDYRGVEFTLAALRGRARVLLVFNRGFF